jgi:predicted hotdog family 3-hydroxylacyl-ACP dehydratase
MSKQNDILALIPQRTPFVMLDEMVFCEGDITRTAFKVKEDNIFLRNGILEEPALIENIAQTAAARAGWIAIQQNKPVAIGYIAAIQQLEIFDRPQLHDLLETETVVTNQVMNVTVVTGKLSCRGRLLAQCEMKIFITNQS